jgi:exonuclease VII small subunit
MQQVINERLTGIEKKVKQLAKKMEQLQKSNLALEEENRKLKSGLAVYKQQANQQLSLGVADTTPISKDKSGVDRNSKKMKKEIEQYLKEIDKCILWLQNN